MKVRDSGDYETYLYTIQIYCFVLWLVMILLKSLGVSAAIRVYLFHSSWQVLRPYVESFEPAVGILYEFLQARDQLILDPFGI
jgi:hypothetical protein